MGRMADARKRARRGDTAAGPPPEPHHEGKGPEPVLVDEPDAEEAASAAGTARGSGKVALPASGLAEDILRQLEAERPERPVPEAEAHGRIELPASGLAEDVLVREAGAGAHSLSFFAAPVQDHRAAAEATEHLATFYLDREEYGVDVRQVQEIRRTTEITSVPRAPEFIRGVINLRGRILPVLDLKRKLGWGRSRPGAPPASSWCG